MKIKIPTGIIKVIIGAALAITSTITFSGPITVTAGTSSATLKEEFSAIFTSLVGSSIYNGNDVSVAESFAGLIVDDPGLNASETFSGSPTDPLTLDSSGGASTGILTGVFDSGFELFNLGVTGLAGGVVFTDIGEGMVAMLFDFDILELGMTLLDNTGGTTLLSFYNATGALVDTVTTTLGGDITFASTLAFRGVAISNTDPGGQGYDSLRFGAIVTAPEPMTLALLGLGLAGLGLSRRKRL